MAKEVVTSGKAYSHAVGNNEPTFESDPFKVIEKMNLSAFPTAICNTIWIKGWERIKMDKRRKTGCCLVCGKKGHMVIDCGEKVKLFNEEKLCFRPQEI
jgi:hypothetical protein